MIVRKRILSLVLGIGAPVSCATLFIFKKIRRNPKNIIPAKRAVASSTTPAILFDLNDVLFTINRKKALQHLGFFDALMYTASGGDPHTLEEKIFDVLSHIEQPKTPESPFIPLHKNKPVPQIMCRWMAGLISTQEVIDQALIQIEQLDKTNFFKDKREKKLVTKAAQLLLDPYVRCKLYKPIPDGFSLVKTCKQLGHNVYLLSNMDSEIMPLLEKEYPELFSLFDGKIISADVQMIKPHANIYEYTLNQYNIDPEKCYFIDDQAENIHGAESTGITGIVCNHKRYDHVYSALHEHGILPSTVHQS